MRPERPATRLPDRVPGELADAEEELLHDLRSLAPRAEEDWFATELYRALGNRRWHKLDRVDGSVSLSWRRAEDVVNELRADQGAPPLELHQTGGEGELSDAVGEELAALGWRSQALDTSSHDEDHVGESPSPPPRGHGEAQAPTEPPQQWRDARAEADER